MDAVFSCVALCTHLLVVFCVSLHGVHESRTCLVFHHVFLRYPHDVLFSSVCMLSCDYVYQVHALYWRWLRYMLMHACVHPRYTLRVCMGWVSHFFPGIRYMSTRTRVA